MKMENGKSAFSAAAGAVGMMPNREQLVLLCLEGLNIPLQTFSYLFFWEYELFSCGQIFQLSLSLLCYFCPSLNFHGVSPQWEFVRL